MDSDREIPVGLHLAQLRVARGLSLRQVAKEIRVHHSRLHDWETGVDAHSGLKSVPPRKQLLSLARFYGVPADPLLAPAGHQTEQEERLLAAFRLLPEEDRAAVLADLEGRVQRR